MNTKVFIVIIVLCVKLSADSEQLTRMKTNVWSVFKSRRLLTYVVKGNSCEPGKKMDKGKCVTDDEKNAALENDYNDEDVIEMNTNETPTPESDDKGDTNETNIESTSATKEFTITPVQTPGDDEKIETNATDITKTSKTDKAKEINNNSTTPIPDSDNKNKRLINIMNKTSTEPTSKANEFNFTKANSSMNSSEYDSKPKTSPANDTNSGAKIPDGDEVSTISKVRNFIIAIFVAAFLVFLIFCGWCLYKKYYVRYSNYTSTNTGIR